MHTCFQAPPPGSARDTDGLAARVALLVGLFPTRRAAAAAAGVSTDQVGRYVAGQNAAPFPVMARMAAAQGVSLDWLATGTGEMRPRPRPPGPDAGVTVWSLQPSAEPGWYRPLPLAVRLPQPPGLLAAETVAVLTPDGTLVGEGLHAGFVCYCSAGSPPLAGDLLLARRPDGLAALLAPGDARWGGPYPLLAPVVLVGRRW